MNILYITRAYGQHGGGMERLSFELARELKQQPNVEITVLAHHGSRAASPLFVLASLPQALAAARKSDVILLGDPVLSLVGWLITLCIHKPVAVIVHGLDITFKNWLYQLYLRLFFRNLNAYFPISKSVNTLLEQIGVTGRRVVITPGISDRFYSPQINRKNLEELLLTTNYSLPTNPKVLLTVGRLVKRKGHAWFIEHVLPLLPENVVYIIAGDGPERSSIAKAAQLNASPDKGRLGGILLLGKVTDDQLKILYNTVDAFVQPNIAVPGDVEGFGLVLLEAALCSRPVFASNIDGIPDAIQAGNNGTLLPSGDAAAWAAALRQHFSDPSLSSVNPRAYTLTTHAAPQRAAELARELAGLAPNSRV